MLKVTETSFWRVSNSMDNYTHRNKREEKLEIKD